MLGDRTSLEHLEKELIFVHAQLCISELLGCNCKDAVHIKCLSQDILQHAHIRIAGPGRGREEFASLFAGEEAGQQ